MSTCKEDPDNGTDQVSIASIIPLHTVTRPRGHFFLSQKVDVHILVVPQSQWKADLRSTHLSICTKSVSAGFVR